MRLFLTVHELSAQRAPHACERLFASVAPGVQELWRLLAWFHLWGLCVLVVPLGDTITHTNDTGVIYA